MADDPLLEPAEAVADGVTALVGVTDEGLRGAGVGLERIADNVDGLRAALPSVVDLSAAVGAAIRDSLAPVQGAAGRDGVDGKDGRDGVDGRNGTDGKDGRDGVDGVDGIGRPGKQGVKGERGLQGDRGADAPTPVRVVGEYDFQQRLEAASVYLDDGTIRRMEARRGPNGRIAEFVRVSA